MSRMTPHEQMGLLDEAPWKFTEVLKPFDLRIFQVNLGRWCNQACTHCHVDASPAGSETISARVVDRCLEVIGSIPSIEVVDLTGGAPEGQKEFRRFAAECRKLGKRVIDRCNLTILSEPGFEDLAAWLADKEIDIVASLPHYIRERVDGQRGKGTHDRSIAGLRRLNALGYGTSLPLHLVYNPTGAFLPPQQQAVEADFKRELQSRHGIVFNSLYIITNMPISRFLEFLLRTGNYDRYMQRLMQAYNPAAAAGVMCRHTLSVGWDGTLYDCDFNQMLDLPVAHSAPSHIRDFVQGRLDSRRILTGQHCYGCTAGAGSSCGGATA